ncbi:MAG: hypothetical protein R3E54_07235 [Halioglobus sp.]
MSTVAGVMLVCSGWTTASASAGERSVRSPGTAVEHTVDRVKTGILPGGGLYSLYSVACVDGAPASLARVDSNARWCTHRGGELVCLKQADAAAEMACSRETVADAGD